MNETKFTPKDIIEQEYRIPLYQRLFAWSEIEVRKLLSDLKAHFESDRFKKNKNPYYLGVITTINHNRVIDLVDGQQRFTVMILLSIYFKKNVEGWKKFYNESKRLKLVARTEDEEFLRNIAKDDDFIKKLRENKYLYINQKMKDALLCIDDFIYNSFSDNENLMIEFANNIYEYLTFFISELPEHYIKNPILLNKYFEDLNSSGRSLEQHEILKVQLLREHHESGKLLAIWNLVSQMDTPIISRGENDNDVVYSRKYHDAINLCREGKYNELLKYIQNGSFVESSEIPNTIDVLPTQKLDKTSSTYSERQSSIISFSNFLLMVLDITASCNGSDSFYQKEKLIERFNKTEFDLDQFYYNLLFYRLLLDYYVVRKDISNGQSRFILNFCDIEQKENSTNNKDKLRQYLSMLTVSTQFYNWMKPYIEYLRDNSLNKSSEEILRWIKVFDNNNRDKTYPQKIKSCEIMYPKIERYWFWRLDYYLWEMCKDANVRCQEIFSKEDIKVVKEYTFRENRSIEHLHPQNESYNEIWDEKHINSFGNLAMVSQSFNSLQSNDNVRVKFARIQEQIDNKALQSIKMLTMYRMANNEHTNWTNELAVRNNDLMCEILDESFNENDNPSEPNTLQI